MWKTAISAIFIAFLSAALGQKSLSSNAVTYYCDKTLLICQPCFEICEEADVEVYKTGSQCMHNSPCNSAFIDPWAHAKAAAKASKNAKDQSKEQKKRLTTQDLPKTMKIAQRRTTVESTTKTTAKPTTRQTTSRTTRLITKLTTRPPTTTTTVKTTTERAEKKCQLEYRLLAESLPKESLRKVAPDCDETGNYLKEQCSSEGCWCVDQITGDERRGSFRNGDAARC